MTNSEAQRVIRKLVRDVVDANGNSHQEEEDFDLMVSAEAPARKTYHSKDRKIRIPKAKKPKALGKCNTVRNQTDFKLCAPHIGEQDDHDDDDQDSENKSAANAVDNKTESGYTPSPWLARVRRERLAREEVLKSRFEALHQHASESADNGSDWETKNLTFDERWYHIKHQLEEMLQLADGSQIGDYFESVVLFATTAYYSSSWVGVTAAALQCAKNLIKAPIVIAAISQYLVDIDVTSFNCQLGEETSSSNPFDDFKDKPMESLKFIRTNWNLFKSNKMYTQFTKLLGLLVNIGLCDASRLDFTIKGFRLFDKDLVKKTANSFDLFDAIFDTVIYFVEGSWQCYQTGSLLPLLVEDYQILSLDERYNEVLQLWSLQESGNLLVLSEVTEVEFNFKLETLLAELVTCSRSAKGIDKTILNQKINKMLDIQISFGTQQLSGAFRKRPFALEIFGRSNQGKSSFEQQLTTCLLLHEDLPTDLRRRKKVKPDSKFDDTVSSSDLVHIYDDVANCKPNFVGTPHTHKIIDECNNVMNIANKADIPNKGKTFMMPEIVNFTTNVKSLNAWDYSNCPYSIQRRMDYVITVKAKKDFQEYGSNGIPIGVHPGKVNAWRKDYEENYGMPPPFDDIWDLDIQKAVQPEDLRQTATYEFICVNGEELRDISMQRCVEFLCGRFADHRKQQIQLVNSLSKKDGVSLCGVCDTSRGDTKPCKNMRGMCSKHADGNCYQSLPSQPSGLPDLVDEEDEEEERVPLNVRKYVSGIVSNIKKDIADLGKPGKGKLNNVIYDPRKARQTNTRGRPTQATKPKGPHANNPTISRAATPVVPSAPTVANPLPVAGESADITLEPHFGEVPEWKSENYKSVGDYLAYSLYTNIFLAKTNKFGFPTFLSSVMKGEESQTDFALRFATQFFSTWSPFCLLSERTLRTKWVQESLFQYYGDDRLPSIITWLTRISWLFWLTAMAIIIAAPYTLVMLILGAWGSKVKAFHFYFILLYIVWTFTKDILLVNIKHKVVKMYLRYDKPMNKIIRNNVINGREQLLATCAVVFALYNLSKLYKLYKSTTGEKAQGNICEVTKETVAARDVEKNPYAAIYNRPLPISEVSKTVSHEILRDVVKKNLLFAECRGKNKEGQDTKAVANVLFVMSNLYLIPYHYIDHYGSFEVTFYRNNPTSPGGSFVDRVDNNFIRIAGSDLALVYCTKGGSFRDISKHFVDGKITECGFAMVYRKEDSAFLEATGRLIPGIVSHSQLFGFEGGRYSNLNINTFAGLCGATLVSDTKGCVILGVHVGGKEGSPEGCMASLEQKTLLTYVQQMNSRYLITAPEGLFRTQILSENILSDAPMAKRSSFNFHTWPEPPNKVSLCYHGSCKGAYTAHSDFMVLPISPIVEKICGVPQKWKAPMFKPSWFGYQACLAHLVKEGKNFDYQILDKCMNDYLGPLVKIITKTGSSISWTEMKPLTPVENTLGIPKKKFMDAIKKNTSIGFPLSGPKLNYMNELEPTEEYPHNFEFKPEIMEEVNYVDNLYRSGQRAYVVAKACKKDEVLSKDKCRIFFGNSIAMTWCVRKYFLPLIRFLQLHPLISECAVGINCHSDEFDQMHKHTIKYPKLFGGDYSNYDQSLPTQLIIYAFNILIDIASYCEYSDEDLAAMRGIASDIAYALVSFDGSLIQFQTNGHLSGNSLTVIINGICGSLNLRYAFFSLNPKLTDFRSHVSVMTYGDDNIGSYKEDCTFGIDHIAKVLEPSGQTYTMPDKSLTLSSTISSEQYEFLKRKPNYIPELDCTVGKLSEDSIFRSLHCGLQGKKSPITPLELCGQNIDSALHEWFNHGREVFEMRREQLKQIAEEAKIPHLCRTLNDNFDSRVDNWKELYKNSEVVKTNYFSLLRFDYGMKAKANGPHASP